MSNIYKVGGALPTDAPSYIRRQADEDLYEGLLAGEFCYVLNSRQMGKSSLRVQTMRRLQEAGVACAAIDITKIGSQGITPEQWYAGMLFTLINQLQLPLTLAQFEDWWEAHQLFSPVNRFSEFIDVVLLREIAGRIVIFIDEIDSVLQLDFKDDFFAAIRACYNKRAENPYYNRLTFALLGVATPSNLIQDKNRTPFNIGRAIQLNGFQFDEAQSLAQGLAGKAAYPEATLQAILNWTGGQPFLTQKLCQLVLASNGSIPEGEETSWIEQLVRTRVIENWESQDEPEHLRTIRDRLLNSEQRASRLLGIYQQILQQEAIEADASSEQIDLRLSGLVAEQRGQLKVYNCIYHAVFDQNWADRMLATLRPYAPAIDAWLISNQTDESLLLRGQTLQNAQTWAVGKSLGDQDYQFLAASQELDRRDIQTALEAEKRAKQILAEANQEANKKAQKANRSVVLGSAALVGTLVIAAIVGMKAQERIRRAEIKVESASKQVGDIEQKAKLAEQRVKLAGENSLKVEKKLQLTQQESQRVTQELASARKALTSFSEQAKKTQLELKVAGEMRQTAEIRVQESQDKLNRIDAALAAIERETSNSIWEAKTLTNIGEVYNSIGQPKKALDFFNQGLQILRKVSARPWEAKTISDIGEVYGNIGQPQKALEYLVQGLPIQREVSDSLGAGTTLSRIGKIYSYIGQSQKALEYYNQALPIHRKVGNRPSEATTLNNIGEVYQVIGQPQKALDYYSHALQIHKEVDNLSGEATTLNNIGEAYRAISQLQKALEYYDQALLIYRDVDNRPGEATTLNNIGEVYQIIGQPQKALEYYNQALPIHRQVYNLRGELQAFEGIGKVYKAINRPIEAISNLEKSARIGLEIRRGLTRENRRNFIRSQKATDTLIALLVSQNEPDRAYNWLNVSATSNLADYTRLLNAKVANSNAQTAIDQWSQQSDQLQLLHQRLQKQFSEDLARQMRSLEAQVNQQAETIVRRFPEIAELFESTPADISQLRASIPASTTIIHPVLLTDASNVPNKIAFFILTSDKLTVTQRNIDSVVFDALLTEAHQQINNRFDDQYLSTLSALYDQLIRPIEAQIQATNPKQLSIIATDKLRYLPFEAFYDSKADQYLIQKYPINYLTRLSTRSLAAKPSSISTFAKRILAIGNPIPKGPWALPGSESEVKSITRILPDSEALIGNKATLDTFKVQALRFPLLHLATHGCFQKGGCPTIGMEENTILFADQQFNIADAALLNLQDVDLITLSASQTALQTNSNGEEIAGLAYLFERAGARSVIASLWSLEDSTTETIMVQLYQNLKKGMSKGEALRQAKLSQIDSHPFFWAPFILIGDAR